MSEYILEAYDDLIDKGEYWDCGDGELVMFVNEMTYIGHDKRDIESELVNPNIPTYIAIKVITDWKEIVEQAVRETYGD